jgi:hypothetical protein
MRIWLYNNTIAFGLFLTSTSISVSHIVAMTLSRVAAKLAIREWGDPRVAASLDDTLCLQCVKSVELIGIAKEGIFSDKYVLVESSYVADTS